MHAKNPVASSKPAVAHQLDIFGGFDEISLETSTLIRHIPPATPKLHDAPAVPTKTINSGLQRKEPKPAAAPAPMPACVHEALRVDPDEPESIDLAAIEAGDTPERILAKRMFLRMIWDFQGKVEEAEPDLFGQTSLTGSKIDHADQNRLDALIWLYSLNPDGSLVTIEWVCDVLGFDPHRVRRIVGRSMRKELKRVVHLLSTIVSPQHAQACEEKISDYLDISNWSLN